MPDLERLYQVFDSIPGESRCLYIDTFAMCCWASKQGQHIAANKLMVDLFNRINLISEGDQSQLLAEIRKTIKGNEKTYALTVPLRAEFRRLFTE